AELERLNCRHAAETRRRWLTSSASGIGSAALAALLQRDGVLAGQPGDASDSLQSTLSHFAPRAKHCIFLFQAGAPSHLDLFDPKPRLAELNGQPLPEEIVRKVRFAFIQKESAVLLGSPRRWRKHGQCGMDFSDYLPQLATCAD
ncbi:MAG: DUF1501 domain-containing protein, partial [Planctomycetaceae bacterium]